MGAISEKIGKMRSEKRGTTLVELIVTFALIGIFLTAASMMLTSTLRTFTRMQATSQTILVSDNILDKVSGEIAAAVIPPKDSSDGYYCWLQPESAAPADSEGKGKSRWIAFCNRSLSPIAIFAAESDGDGHAIDNQAEMGHGQLFVRYYAMSGEAIKNVPQLDWHYDEKVYMGYRIKDMWFSRDDAANHPNVIKINLEVEHNRTGFTYSTFRYVECYNINSTNIDMDHPYICARNDENPGEFPAEAEEFRIKGGGGGDKPDEPDEPGEPDEPDGPDEPDVPDLPDGYSRVLVTLWDDYNNRALVTDIPVTQKFNPHNQYIGISWTSFSSRPEVTGYYVVEGYYYQRISVGENETVRYTIHYEPVNVNYRVEYKTTSGTPISPWSISGSGKYGTTLTFKAPQACLDAGYRPVKKEVLLPLTTVGDKVIIFYFYDKGTIGFDVPDETDPQIADFFASGWTYGTAPNPNDGKINAYYYKTFTVNQEPYCIILAEDGASPGQIKKKFPQFDEEHKEVSNKGEFGNQGFLEAISKCLGIEMEKFDYNIVDMTVKF